MYLFLYHFWRRPLLIASLKPLDHESNSFPFCSSQLFFLRLLKRICENWWPSLLISHWIFEQDILCIYYVYYCSLTDDGFYHHRFLIKARRSSLNHLHLFQPLLHYNNPSCTCSVYKEHGFVPAIITFIVVGLESPIPLHCLSWVV